MARATELLMCVLAVGLTVGCERTQTLTATGGQPQAQAQPVDGNEMIVNYRNPGPTPHPVKFTVPAGARVTAARAIIKAHSGGTAPYSLTAICFSIDGQLTWPNTGRISANQIRGEGTLWAWGKGQTKELNIDLASVTTPDPDKEKRGSVQFSYLPHLTPGEHTLNCYVHVGSEAWSQVKMVMTLEPR